MIITKVTGPLEEPVGLAEVKDFLKINHTDHDGQLLSLITAARTWVEEYTNRSLTQRRWKYYRNDWPRGNSFELPFPPLRSVTTIKYTDVDDTETTWDASYYEVDTDSEPGRIILAYDSSWPSVSLHPKNPIEITYIGGYPDDGASPPDYTVNIPQEIINALMIHVEILYDRPVEAYMRVLTNVRDSLLSSYRCTTFDWK